MTHHLTQLLPVGADQEEEATQTLPGWAQPDLAEVFSAGPSSAASMADPARIQLFQHLINSQRFPLPPLGDDEMSDPSTSSCPTLYRKSPTKKAKSNFVAGRSTRDEMGNVVFKCSMCDSEFKTSSGLAYHERQNHRDLPQYRCSICAKGFVSRGHYVGHMNMHNNTKTFVCTVCYKTFAYMSSLKFHLKMHTNAQVFECPVCAKKFAYEKSFKSHLNTHNRANAFNCPHCPKKFAYRSSLQYHLKTGCRGVNE